MFITELDSFIGKFQQLWNNGVTAHLDLDTHAGSAWVGLRVHLGNVPPGPHHTAPYGPAYPPPRHVTPSRHRRRARREAARNKKAEEAVEDHPIVEEIVQDGDTGEVSINMKDNTIVDEAAVEVTHKTVDIDVIDEVCPDEEFNIVSAVKEQDEEEIVVDFVSDYAEEDVKDAIKELYDEGFVPSLPILVSRMRLTQRGPEHQCNVKLILSSRQKKSFTWPSLKDCPDFFQNVKIL